MLSVSAYALLRPTAGISVAVFALLPLPAFAQSTPEEQTEAGTTAAANEGSRAAQGTVATEEAPLVDEGGLDVITVIGTTKRLEDALDVPSSITAFTGESLETKNAIQISDVATYTPGFNVTPAPGNATAITLAIRGQTQTDILATLEPSVGTYVDELYWGRAYGLNAGLVDTANVQVLKGPQGTLFGRNTTGGALLITTADPDPDAFSGRVAATYGRYNEMVGEMVVNVPIGDSFALRGAFKLSHRDGWAYGVRTVNAAGAIDNTITGTRVVPDGRRLNDRSEVQGRVKALWEVTDNTSLLVSAEFYDFSLNGPGRQIINKLDLDTPGAGGDRVAVFTSVNAYEAFFRDNPNAAGADAFNCSFAINMALNCTDTLHRGRRPYTEANTETYLAKLTHDFTFGTMKLIGGYRNVMADNLVDLDGSGTPIHATSLTQDLSQSSVEAQLAGTALGDALDYVIGATYFTENGTDLSYSFTGGASSPAVPVGSVPGNATRNFGDIDNESIGAYTQLKYSFTDAVSVYGGVRYSEDEKGLEIRSANVNLMGVPTPLAPGPFVAGTTTDPCNAAGAGVIAGATLANDCAAFRKDKFTSVSWTAGVDFKPVDDVLLYAKISKGYRSGGQNLRAFNTLQFVPFEPETLIEQEVGFKGEFLDRRLRVTLAGYHNELSDAQRSTIVTTGGASNTIVGNAAKVRNYGFEADVLLEVAEGLILSASGSYNKPEYLSYPDTVLVAGVPTVVDRSGERFQGLVDKKFSVGANYDTRFGDVSLNANVDYSWAEGYAGDECTVTGPSACYAGAAGIGGVTTAQLSQQVFDATSIPSADLLNARVTFGFNDDMFKLAFFGRNLLDDRGIIQTLSLNAPRRNYVSGLRREPLTYGVTASVAW